MGGREGKRTITPCFGKELFWAHMALLPSCEQLPPHSHPTPPHPHPGTGGDEACIFALELFRMYERYASTQRWRFETIELAENDVGGCKLASATVSGAGDVYGRLKFESGIHRVQRVPATESGGRVHTSAASVVVMPQVGLCMCICGARGMWVCVG